MKKLISLFLLSLVSFCIFAEDYQIKYEILLKESKSNTYLPFSDFKNLKKNTEYNLKICCYAQRPYKVKTGRLALFSILAMSTSAELSRIPTDCKMDNDSDFQTVVFWPRIFPYNTGSFNYFEFTFKPTKTGSLEMGIYFDEGYVGEENSFVDLEIPVR